MGYSYLSRPLCQALFGVQRTHCLLAAVWSVTSSCGRYAFGMSISASPMANVCLQCMRDYARAKKVCKSEKRLYRGRILCLTYILWIHTPGPDLSSSRRAEWPHCQRDTPGIGREAQPCLLHEYGQDHQGLSDDLDEISHNIHMNECHDTLPT